MVVEITDTFSAMKSLNAVLRFVGLCSVYRDGNTLRQSPSLCKVFFYTITLTLVNILTLYVKFYMYGGLSSFSFKDAIHFIYLLGYFLYLIDVYFVYKYRQLYLEYIKMYDNIDRILGTNYINLLKPKIMTFALLFVISDLSCSIFEYISWVFFYGFLLATTYSIEFAYFIFKSLSMADMVANIIQLEYRLRAIGDLLQNYNTNSFFVKSRKNELIIKSLDNEVCKRDTLEAVDNDGAETIMWITRCYLFILDQADCINTMYGFRILMTSFVILKTLVILMNIILRLILGSLHPDSQEMKYFFIISTILRLITRSYVAIAAIHRIEICYEQVERIIKIIDHTLIIRNVSPPTARALRGLRELILSRPLSFHAYSFVRLDYAYILSISSAAVTYTIILMQYVQ